MLETQPAFRSPSVRISTVDYWLLIFALLLLRLPIALGYRDVLVIRWLFVIPFIASIILKLPYLRTFAPQVRANRPVIRIFLLYAAIWALGLVRGALHRYSFDTFFILGQLATLAAVGCFAFLALNLNHPDSPERTRPFRPILYSYAVYLCFNLVFLAIGLIPDDRIYLAKYPAQMLSFVGLSFDRVLFPMADGINAFGILAGAVLAGLVPLIGPEGRALQRIKIGFLAACGLAVILLTDSRGALLSALCALILVFLPFRFRRQAIWVPFMASLLPIVMMAAAPSFLSENFAWLNRPRSNLAPTQAAGADSACADLLAGASGSLSNRPIIWNAALDELRQPKWTHLVGFGFRGHYVSGISSRYSCLFSSYAFSALASTHNIWLQTVFDVGYIGLLVTLALLGVLIRQLLILHAGTGNAIFQGLLAIMLYVVMAGSLEASISPDFSELFILILLICIVVIRAGAVPAAAFPIGARAPVSIRKAG